MMKLHQRWKKLDWHHRLMLPVLVVIAVILATHFVGFVRAMWLRAWHWNVLLREWQDFNAGALQVGAATIAVLAVFRQIASTEELEKQRLQREITAQRILLTIEVLDLLDYAKKSAGELARLASLLRNTSTRHRRELYPLPVKPLEALRSLIALGGTKEGDRLLHILHELVNNDRGNRIECEKWESHNQEQAYRSAILYCWRFLNIHAQCGLLQNYLMIVGKGFDFITRLSREEVEISAERCVSKSDLPMILEYIQQRPYPLPTENLAE